MVTCHLTMATHKIDASKRRPGRARRDSPGTLQGTLP